MPGARRSPARAGGAIGGTLHTRGARDSISRPADSHVAQSESAHADSSTLRRSTKGIWKLVVDGAGAVKLVDAFSGRVLEGRRYADGFHSSASDPSLKAKYGNAKADYSHLPPPPTFGAPPPPPPPASY